MADEIPATPEQFKKMLDWWQEHQPWYVTEFRLTTLMPNLRMGFISLRQEQRGNDEPLLLTYVDEQHIEMNGGLSMTQDQVQRFIMDLNDTKQLVMVADTGAFELLPPFPETVKVELLVSNNQMVRQLNVFLPES